LKREYSTKWLFGEKKEMMIRSRNSVDMKMRMVERGSRGEESITNGREKSRTGKGVSGSSSTSSDDELVWPGRRGRGIVEVRIQRRNAKGKKELDFGEEN
jgi:hypothetical protein